MLFEVYALYLELQSVCLIALGVNSSTQSELDAFSHEVVWYFEGIGELLDLPILDLFACKVKSRKFAALVVLQIDGLEKPL